MQGAATSTGQRTWLSLQGQRVRTRAVGTEVLRNQTRTPYMCTQDKINKDEHEKPNTNSVLSCNFFQVFNLIGNITS